MKSLQRVNNSVLGAVERPALVWMTRHLPAWVLPNHLTALGLAGALFAAALRILSGQGHLRVGAACHRRPRSDQYQVGLRGCIHHE